MNFCDTESTPLVGEMTPFWSKNKCTQKWKQIKRTTIKYKLHVYIPNSIISLIVFTFITIFFVHVQPNLGNGVAEGTYFSTDNVSLLGLGDTGGINLQISGTNTNNYTNIADLWTRQYFKKGGFVMRELNLKIEELDLIVFDSNKGDDMNLGKVEIMPFYVQIVDGKSTNMDLFVTLWPNSKGVRGILKKLLLDSNTKLRLRGDAQVKVYVFNGFIPVSSISIPMDLEFF